MGNSHFDIIIVNNTEQDIVGSEIYDYSQFDFMGWTATSLFEFEYIKAKKRARVEITTNPIARNCPLTLKLKFSDQSIDIIRIQSKDSFYTSADMRNLNILQGAHDITYKLEKNKTYLTILITIENTHEQKMQNLLQEADQEVRENKLKEAIKTLKKAMNLADSDQERNNIRKLMADIHAKEASDEEKKALESETDKEKDNSKIADEHFKKSILKLKEAVATTDQNLTYKEAIDRIKKKQSGNTLYNEAHRLHEQGFQLFKDGKYAAAMDKYQEAALKMEQAKQKFDECLKQKKEYQFCSDQAGKERDAMNRTKHNLQVIQLKEAMGKLVVNEDRYEQPVVALEDDDIKQI